MYNSVTIVGYVGNDPEMRFTPSGVEVATVSIATSEKRKDAQGNMQETTIWWRVSLWRQNAVSLSERVRKGMKLLVVGKFSTPPRTYQDKQGNWVASLEITGETWRVVDWGDKGAVKDIDVIVENSEPIPF